MNKEPELFVDDHHGIYALKVFAECINRERVVGITDENYTILEEGPDHEWYWEAWDEVIDSAVLTGKDGTEYYLWQDGALWIVPKEYENEDFFGV